MLVINPYKLGSRSARSIRDELLKKGTNSKCLTRQAKNPTNPILNWGNSEFKYNPPPGVVVINPPAEAAKLTNKLRFFKLFDKLGDIVVPWDTDPRAAMTWDKTVARCLLEGSGGDGIVIWNQGDPPIVKAPLYTKYLGKTHEYRVHMGRGLFKGPYKPLLIQRKVFKKTPELPAPKQWEVRNHAHGFFFVANNPQAEPVPPMVMEVAEKIMNGPLKGLHFCALDIIYNNKTKKAHVLEGNTAPGMEGNTIAVYADYIHGLCKEIAA